MNRIWCLGLALLLSTNSAEAGSIKIPLGDTSPDVIYDGFTFHTLDDGNAATLGDQNTRVLFTGFGSLYTDIILPIASFSLLGVTAVGPSTLTAGTIAQETTGGSFFLWDENNDLLLSGLLTAGALSGGSAGTTTGSFYNTQYATFTGGSLATTFAANSASLSLALNDIISASFLGMHLTNGQLDPFRADASGLINGTSSAVPEPGTVLLFATGLFAARLRRNRNAALQGETVVPATS